MASSASDFSFIRRLLERRTMAAHITMAPGLATRAAFLKDLIRETQICRFRFVYVVPTKQEALFTMMKKNLPLEALLSTQRCLFILEDPVASNDFWPTAAADILLDWIRERYESKKGPRSLEIVGLVTLSSRRPNELWSEKVDNAIDEPPRHDFWEDPAAPLAPETLLSRTYHLWDYQNITTAAHRLRMRVRGIALARDPHNPLLPPGEPPRRLSVVCVSDSRDYEDMVDGLENATSGWIRSIDFHPYISIKASIDQIRNTWAEFCAAPEPKIIGLDPAFHFMYPYDDSPSDIVVTGTLAGKCFDQGLGGLVYQRVVRRLDPAMRQAEAHASGVTHMHYLWTSVDDQLPPGERDWKRYPSLEEIFLQTNFYPRPFLSLDQLQLYTPPIYPRELEWTTHKVKTMMRSLKQALGPSAPECVYQILLKYNSLKVAFLLAPCFAATTSIRIKKTMIILAAIQAVLLEDPDAVMRLMEVGRASPFDVEDYKIEEDNVAGIAKAQAYKGGMWLLAGFFTSHIKQLQDGYLVAEDESWIPMSLEIYLPLIKRFADTGRLMAELVGFYGDLVEDFEAIEDEVPLTDKEVLEIECHMVRAFVFELMRSVDPTERRAYCVSTRNPVR
ncbi:hypothetical protein B0T19DRAFT_468584 [Cercophora scortea]|uniref:Uncharacterized protein n=1 Tax=Cercophora scortea TaxID=314031 RepID=A0AAE0I906_9PEZI|nr:hypothetical protein B0T19DRAFT_468584 [Cercophora scortea]